MTTMGGDPHEEGRDAFERGVPRGECPYPAGTPEHEAWIEGWDEAQEVGIVEGRDDDAG